MKDVAHWSITAVLLSALALCGGCGGTAGTNSPIEGAVVTAVLPADECIDLRGEAVRGGDIVVALDGPVDSHHAPIPHNDGERAVFRNFYENLVTVSCEGELESALAENWEARDEGRTWVFQLRIDATFWDGTPLRASHVRESWITTAARGDLPHRLAPLRWLNPRNESVRVMDGRRLMITLPEITPELPLLLTHPALAIVGPVDGATGWPLGSGPCRPVSDTTDEIVCAPFAGNPEQPRWRNVIFRSLPDADPRDLPDRGCDILLIRDRADLAFFEARPDFQVSPLPWDRIYLLMHPALGTGPEHLRWLTGWRREDLAADVMAADATAAEHLFLYQPTRDECPQLTGPVAGITASAGIWDEAMALRGPDVILFPEGDPDARRLAERLVVLAARIDLPGADADHRALPPRAAGLSETAFAIALQSGIAGAFLLPVRGDFPAGCFQLADLLGRAGWLQRAAINYGGPALSGRVATLTPGPETAAAARLRDTSVVTPLVASRAHLISREGLCGIRAAHDGTPLLGGAGWRVLPAPNAPGAGE